MEVERQASDAELPASKVIATEPATPPHNASVEWAPLSETTLAAFDHTAQLIASVTDSSATLSLELRADVDGAFHSLSFGPVALEPGDTTTWSVGAADLAIGEDLQFSAMIEGKLFVTRDGHTRNMRLEPVYVHPAETGFLLYGEHEHETLFRGGDFRESMPTTIDGEEAEPLAHISVAHVQALGPGENTELE